MKRYIIPFIIAALLPAMAFADKVQGTLTLTTPATKAFCIYDTEAKTATLGNGYNACINHYEDGVLYIPGTVRYNSETYHVVIGQFAFRMCNKFTKIIVQEGVEHIGDYAFVGCSAVTAIDLPSTLITIGAGAFCNLTSLNTMQCRSATAPTWDWNDVFSVLGNKESMKDMALQRSLIIPENTTNSYLSYKFDGTSTAAHESVGWSDAFARIYEASSDPVEISSPDEFKAFRDAVNAGTMTMLYSGRKYFVLTTDIDLNHENWTPIGTSAHTFSGYFNGGGHVIKNLKVENGSADYQGLFGYTDNATVYNMHLLNPQVEGKDYVGSVVGYAHTNSHITDVLVTSDASSGNDYTVKSVNGSGGGIVGYAKDATIERCMFRGQVKCTGWTGGIVGNVNNNVTITDCSASNFLQNLSYIASSAVGGIVGGAGGVTVNRCFARNIISWNFLNEPYRGAIVGQTNSDDPSNIANCAYWTDININEIATYLKMPTLTGNVKYSTEADMNQDKTKTVLGTDDWYYFTDNYVDYPVPATLADMYIKGCVNIADGDFVYRPAGESKESYEVVAYTGSAAAVTVPETYNSKPVTAIQDNAFKDNQTMTTVTLGSNLTTIGAHAFENCDALTAVDLPDAVTMVKEDAFRGCDNLVSFNIGTGFENHVGNFIAYCPKLTTLTASRGNDNGYLCADNVLIHNIGSYCSYVIACAPGKTGNYTIPVGSLPNNTVDVLGSCFATCTGLTSVTFPAGKLYSLGKGVFDGAYNLRYVDLSAITGTIDDVTYNVDRNDPDSPFYGMSDYTFIYLPADKGHTAALGEPNVVIGTAAQQLELNDAWDFAPKVSPITTTYGVGINRRLSPSLVEVTQSTDEEITIEGEATTKQEGEYQYAPMGYTSYLPYALTLVDEDAKVYKPTSSETTAGVTTITFTQVEGNVMEAYKPYYIVVTGNDDVDLSTNAAVTVGSNTSGTWTVNDYEFKGTTAEIPNTQLYDAQKPAYILQSSGMWHKVPQNQPEAYVAPFRCYFQATGTAQANSLSMVIENASGTGIQQIRTIDTDGTERYFDLNGRQLSGKPQKGMYIMNGKKYVNK